jgi:hypothetical protein
MFLTPLFKYNNNMDQIEAKLKSLDLKIQQPLKVSSNIKAPSAWIRLRGDKAYIHLGP